MHLFVLKNRLDVYSFVLMISARNKAKSYNKYFEFKNDIYPTNWILPHTTITGLQVQPDRSLITQKN